ncbi:hypothetical protein Q8A67_020257 [Cirrhinus molitorella]|uniref:Secreted protein n=1 Tax=Cirrhinus molitorella TaxID=172907 RepID=A0AA88PBJ6_9TELE|nr:hypothetical protein Q8A67_020257 [Cirrhinus molitorella]
MCISATLYVRHWLHSLVGLAVVAKSLPVSQPAAELFSISMPGSCTSQVNEAGLCGFYRPPTCFQKAFCNNRIPQRNTWPALCA